MSTKFDWGSGYYFIDEEAITLYLHFWHRRRRRRAEIFHKRFSVAMNGIDRPAPCNNAALADGFEQSALPNSSRNEVRSYCDHNNYGLLLPLICFNNTLTSP
jgi:hypothetical protein